MLYDACYYVEVEQTEYPIIGINRFDIIDEDLIIKQHLLYWNRNDVPISVIILPGEYRIYNNFSRKKNKTLLYNSKNQNKNITNLLEDFKASRITTKVVWDRLIELSGSSDRVDKQLLINLKNTVVQVHTEYDMPLENAYNFMSQCILSNIWKIEICLLKKYLMNGNRKESMNSMKNDTKRNLQQLLAQNDFCEELSSSASLAEAHAFFDQKGLALTLEETEKIWYSTIEIQLMGMALTNEELALVDAGASVSLNPPTPEECYKACIKRNIAAAPCRRTCKY